MTRTGNQNPDEGLVQRVEVLLSSLTAVVSARVILDPASGAHVHIIATSELPVSEVSRAVMSALTWGLGFEVPSNQITVVQSSLSRVELRGLLDPKTTEASATPVAPESPPPSPKPSVPATGLVEFSLGSSQGEQTDGSELGFRRLELQDLQLKRHAQGGFAISVRLADDDQSIGAQREAAGTEEDSLEVPACAALGVIQEFLRAGRDGLGVVLRFMSARRLRHPQHDVVVVLVEAVVGGRRIPLTGAASSRHGVERASVLATLQATNAFVAGTLKPDSANGASAE